MHAACFTELTKNFLSKFLAFFTMLPSFMGKKAFSFIQSQLSKFGPGSPKTSTGLGIVICKS